MYTEKHLIELFNDHDYIYRKSCIQFCIKNKIGQVIYNITKKMVGQTQRPWIRQNPTSCLTQCQTEKKSFRQLRNIYKKTAWCTTLCGENAVNFLCTPNEELEIAPPKIWMYPQK